MKPYIVMTMGEYDKFADYIAKTIALSRIKVGGMTEEDAYEFVMTTMGNAEGD